MQWGLKSYRCAGSEVFRSFWIKTNYPFFVLADRPAVNEARRRGYRDKHFTSLLRSMLDRYPLLVSGCTSNKI